MLKLLIVDDEKLVREGLKKCFNWFQYNITEIQEACNGEEALDKIANFKPDIILLDVMIPVISGIEVSKVIKDELPSSKIIFISGYNDVNYLKSALKVNAVHYIFKPVEIDELENAIEKAVNMIEADSIRSLRESFHLKKKESCAGDLEEFETGGNNINVKDDCDTDKDYRDEDKEQGFINTKYRSRIVNCAKEYIDKNYTKNISISTIAEYLHLTPNYVSLLFKQEMGMTIMSYITQLRMNKALKLLKESNLKVSEVADSVGYKDPNYFSKLFKRYYGYNPSDFRFTQYVSERPPQYTVE